MNELVTINYGKYYSSFLTIRSDKQPDRLKMSYWTFLSESMERSATEHIAITHFRVIGNQ